MFLDLISSSWIAPNFVLKHPPFRTQIRLNLVLIFLTCRSSIRSNKLGPNSRNIDLFPRNWRGYSSIVCPIIVFYILSWIISNKLKMQGLIGLNVTVCHLYDYKIFELLKKKEIKNFQMHNLMMRNVLDWLYL